MFVLASVIASAAVVALAWQSLRSRRPVRGAAYAAIFCAGSCGFFSAALEVVGGLRGLFNGASMEAFGVMAVLAASGIVGAVAAGSVALLARLRPQR